MAICSGVLIIGSMFVSKYGAQPAAQFTIIFSLFVTAMGAIFNKLGEMQDLHYW